MGKNPKICLVSIFSSHYRKEIYSMMDKYLGVDFIFGDGDGSLKSLDLEDFRNARRVHNKTLFSNFYYQPGVLKMTKDYDVIIGDLGIFCLTEWALRFIGKLRGQRVYFWSHGWYGRESWIKRVLKRVLFKNADGMFLYGQYAKDLMIKEGFKPDRLYVIHNSLDYSEQLEIRKTIHPTDIYINHFGNNDPILLFIGRLTKVKKLHLLIEAVSFLKEKSKNYNIVFVGDGSEENYLKELVNNKKLEEQVWFYGACYDEKKNAELIYNADLCVSPGNVGLTSVHSLGFGTPVITHDNYVWQMPEFEAIEKGKTGDFFKQDDVNSIAMCIQNWFERHNNREEIRQACYRVIDESWNPNYQLQLLKNVIIKNESTSD